MNGLERTVFWLVAVGTAALALTYFFTHTRQPELPTSWDYKDVVSILLAIVTIALTVLGVIIAVAAFYSYQKLTEIASERAGEVAGDVSATRTTTFLGSADFHARVDAIILERIANMRKDEIEPSLDVTADGVAAPAADTPWTDQ